MTDFTGFGRAKPFTVATSAAWIEDASLISGTSCLFERGPFEVCEVCSSRSSCDGVAASAGTTTSQTRRHAGHRNSKPQRPVEASRSARLVSFGSVTFAVSFAIASSPSARACVERTYRSRHAACAPCPHVTGRKPTHSSASTDAAKGSSSSSLESCVSCVSRSAERKEASPSTD